MLIQILLIGVSVSMDAFAVSIGKGLTVKKLRGVDAFKTALWFGGFQALFPLLGYFAASTFSKYVTAVDHWIYFRPTRPNRRQHGTRGVRRGRGERQGNP